MQDKVASMVSDAVAWDKLKPAYLKLYLDAYSEEELDGIIASYKSPAGQTMVTKYTVRNYGDVFCGCIRYRSLAVAALYAASFRAATARERSGGNTLAYF